MDDDQYAADKYMALKYAPERTRACLGYGVASVSTAHGRTLCSWVIVGPKPVSDTRDPTVNSRPRGHLCGNPGPSSPAAASVQGREGCRRVRWIGRCVELLIFNRVNNRC